MWKKKNNIPRTAIYCTSKLKHCLYFIPKNLISLMKQTLHQIIKEYNEATKNTQKKVAKRLKEVKIKDEQSSYVFTKLMGF